MIYDISYNALHINFLIVDSELYKISFTLDAYILLFYKIIKIVNNNGITFQTIGVAVSNLK